MSTSFALFDILTTSTPRFAMICIAMSAAFRSFILILPPILRPLSSPKTSSGTIHITSSVVFPFMIASKSIFCFAHVRTKFVSIRIFIGGNRFRLCFWFLVFDFSWLCKLG